MDIITELDKYIDVYYLIAFMSLAYTTKGWVNSLLQYISKMRIKKHHLAVFIIGSLTALPFWLYFEHDKMKLFLTYAIGTAIHSHLINYVLNKFKPKKNE